MRQLDSDLALHLAVKMGTDPYLYLMNVDLVCLVEFLLITVTATPYTFIVFVQVECSKGQQL
jgi:hypothetical protein